MALSDGVIHDIGYQHYTGRRLGGRYATASLYTHSLRSAFGLGRSGKAKVFPFIVVGLAFFVAVVAVAMRSLMRWRQQVPTSRASPLAIATHIGMRTSSRTWLLPVHSGTGSFCQFDMIGWRH